MIQIDMEMPSCCYDCNFSIGVMMADIDRECTITDKYVNDDDKPEWCPLIDVPDINVGNSSEIPNSSTDCISRQAAIDALCSVCGVDCDKSKFVYGGKQEDQVILCPEHYALTQLPSTQPEIILCKDCTWCQNDTVHGKVFCSREGAMDWIEPDSWCSYREGRTE